MDASFVAISIVSTWLIPLLSLLAGSEEDGSAIRCLTVLRAIRILRVARMIRTNPIFRPVWLLLRGLADSTVTLLWTLSVVFFITYVYAIFGAAIIVEPLNGRLAQAKEISAPSEQDLLTIADLEDLSQLYGGIDQIMYKLIQAFFVDSIHAEMDRLLKYLWYTWAYFYAYFGFAVLVLMNLVTAILVDNAVTCSQQDAEIHLQEKTMARNRDLQELRAFFELLDTDRNAIITWEEFKESFNDEAISKKWALLDFRPEECKELFDTLHDGVARGIDVSDFFDGLQHMRGPAMSKDMFRLEKMLRKIENNHFTV